MGGEYLPTVSTSEVEFARIRINSTTGDVTSVYTSLLGRRMAYRVVDEYQGDTLSDPKRSDPVRVRKELPAGHCA